MNILNCWKWPSFSSFSQKVKVPNFDEISLGDATPSSITTIATPASTPSTTPSSTTTTTNVAMTNNNVDENKFSVGLSLVKQVAGETSLNHSRTIKIFLPFIKRARFLHYTIMLCLQVSKQLCELNISISCFGLGESFHNFQIFLRNFRRWHFRCASPAATWQRGCCFRCSTSAQSSNRCAGGEKER